MNLTFNYNSNTTHNFRHSTIQPTSCQACYISLQSWVQMQLFYELFQTQYLVKRHLLKCTFQLNASPHAYCLSFFFFFFLISTQCFRYYKVKRPTNKIPKTSELRTLLMQLVDNKLKIISIDTHKLKVGIEKGRWFDSSD